MPGLSGISQPYRIDIFEDYIYGTGLKHEVFKVHKYGKQPVEFFSLGMVKPTNVLIYHRFKQQDGESLSVCLSTCLSVYMSVCLPSYLSTFLSVSPSTCLSVCLSIHILVLCPLSSA